MLTTFVNVLIAIVLITIGSLGKEIIGWVADTIEKMNLSEKLYLPIVSIIIILMMALYITFIIEYMTYLSRMH